TSRYHGIDGLNSACQRVAVANDDSDWSANTTVNPTAPTATSSAARAATSRGPPAPDRSIPTIRPANTGAAATTSSPDGLAVTVSAATATATPSAAGPRPRSSNANTTVEPSAT